MPQAAAFAVTDFSTFGAAAAAGVGAALAYTMSASVTPECDADILQVR